MLGCICGLYRPWSLIQSEAVPTTLHLRSLLSNHCLKWIRWIRSFLVLDMPHPTRVLKVDSWSSISLNIFESVLGNVFGLFIEILNCGKYFSQCQRIVILTVSKLALLTLILRLEEL